MPYVLPEKLPGYLVRLQVAFDKKGKTDLGEIIATCHYFVREEDSYDNWNGGQWGHAVILFLPLEQLAKIDIEDQEDVANDIRERLNKMCKAIDDEWFTSVSFELFDGNDAECKKSRPFSLNPPINPDTLDFWKPGTARVFISHRDKHKKAARDLSESLEQYGVSCFVAHDTIKPLSEWRHEIMKGLQTMEVMVIFLTEDFEESMWCNQEVGFALGKNVPIISLKLGAKDPPGFISHVQALKGQIGDPFSAAKGLFPLIGQALHCQERLQEILITSFVESPSWIDAKDRFIRMTDSVEKLSDKQLERIIKAYKVNTQLSGSIYLANQARRLLNFLEKVSGKRFENDGKIIREVVEEPGDSIVSFLRE